MTVISSLIRHLLIGTFLLIRNGKRTITNDMLALEILEMNKL